MTAARNARLTRALFVLTLISLAACVSSDPLGPARGSGGDGADTSDGRTDDDGGNVRPGRDTGVPGVDTDLPGIDTDLPDTGGVDTELPDTPGPDTNLPDTGGADAGGIDTDLPDTPGPDTDVPDTGVDTDLPDTPGPDTGTAECGNGIVEAGEACDDGNFIDGDACSNTCHDPIADLCRPCTNRSECGAGVDICIVLSGGSYCGMA